MKQALNRLNALEVALIARYEKVGHKKTIDKHIRDVYKQTIVGIKLGYFLRKKSWHDSYLCIVDFQPRPSKNGSSFFEEQMQELEKNES